MDLINPKYKSEIYPKIVATLPPSGVFSFLGFEPALLSDLYIFNLFGEPLDTEYALPAIVSIF